MLKIALIVSCCVLFCDGYSQKPGLNCFQNEHSVCVRECPPEKTCRNRGIKFNCLLNDRKRCKPKCVCDPGYFRNAIGTCITEAQCDLCTGPNEYYSCGGACDNVCSELHYQNQTNCPIINIKCNEKCYCDVGYARDRNNICVPIENCPKHHSQYKRYANKPSSNACSGPNEVFSECKRTCPPDTCISLVARFRCKADEPCQKGCSCAPGFLRNQSGSPCIPYTSCPQLAHSVE